ncbi:phage regulatory CII family protein [Jejubacter calystegiae]|uniref:Phage regulatory CII family protein n=1 Tax=Jejubacter calystegiae TaxID=2579935 RepID=A0A4P8YFK4_9ENTR|nr:phage regulatory CII family protein [Jejubacter calystegiae]QCT18546.1 phage regulatory CII family protein [Jejubacter calystegiae]
MLDYRVSSHAHFDDACRKFAAAHNVAELAKQAGIRPHTLYNKLNPEQPHQLTPREIWALTDITEDPTLVDGFLAQIHCLPCVPLNEVAKEKMPHYVMSATAEIGKVAGAAVSGDVKTTAARRAVIDSINSVTRLMALTAVTLQARLQANPAMTSAVDTVTGQGASFGLM